MKDKVLFFITSEFPYGKGETFIENEILFLADYFEKIIIIPLTATNSACRTIPSNVFTAELSLVSVNWITIFNLIRGNTEIYKEFFSNLISNPLKNKVLLKSINNAVIIHNQLKKLQSEFHSQINVYYSYWLDDGAIAISFLENTAVKFSRTHNWDLYYEKNYLNYLPLRKFLAERLNGIFSISENGKHYLDNITMKPDKIFLSRLGTINSPLEISDNLSISKLNIISISNINSRKRIDIIGDAVRLSSEQIIWNHFGDGNLFEKIKNQYPQGNFHGFLDNNSIKTYLGNNSGNSLLVNTSSGEGIPVSMMEAMSFGIPCLGTNVGGVSEIIKDGINGYLMPADATPEIVAEFIKKYFNLSFEEKKLMKRNAYVTWHEKFNADKNYPDFIEKINSLISR